MVDELERMQGALSPEDAERFRLRLERRYAPNQVLSEGSAELAEAIVAGMARATEAGRLESWELLAQLAVGAVPPTSAPPDVVAAGQDALRAAVPFMTGRLAESSGGAVESLIIDVLDAVLDYAGPQRAQILDALTRFAARGDREAGRVQIILDDVRGH